MRFSLVKAIAAFKKQNWHSILSDGSESELALLWRAAGPRMAAALTEDDWQVISQVGRDATCTASKRGSFWQKPKPREVWQRDIALELIKHGLVLPHEDKRWWAWLALWEIEAGRAHAELVPDCFGCITDIDGLPELPPGAIFLKRASAKLGRPVELLTKERVGLKVLDESRRKRDRELAARLREHFKTWTQW